MDKDLTNVLKIITQASYTVMEKRLTKYGIVKGQANLLAIIKDNDGCTQKDLANFLNVKYSSMSERLDKLEESGYIVRNIDEYNSRYKRIYITQEGKVAANQCKRIQAEFEQNLYKGFTKKDLKQFESYLDKLESNIEKML